MNTYRTVYKGNAHILFFFLPKVPKISFDSGIHDFVYLNENKKIKYVVREKKKERDNEQIQTFYLSHLNREH